jgi:hypothetical protein
VGAEEMNSPQAVANLEVLLVELQYAVADLAYEKAPMRQMLCNQVIGTRGC